MLKSRCPPVLQVDDAVRAFIADMIETMVARHGIGLAAPQVGRLLRLFVVDIWWPTEGVSDKAQVFINPVLSRPSGQQHEEEGCLSLPGIRERVTRAQKIRVSALDIHGHPFEMDAEGLLAVAIQHENDHLNGVLTLDRLSPQVRKMAVRKLT